MVEISLEIRAVATHRLESRPWVVGHSSGINLACLQRAVTQKRESSARRDKTDAARSYRQPHTLRDRMKIGLNLIPKLCVLGVLFYLYVSVNTAAWATKRHEGKLLFLEWQPTRARGSQELKRLNVLRRLRFFALLTAIIAVAVQAFLFFR